jgi:hypothetical protein
MKKNETKKSHATVPLTEQQWDFLEGWARYKFTCSIPDDREESFVKYYFH